jgi:hypothetical protein
MTAFDPKRTLGWQFRILSGWDQIQALRPSLIIHLEKIVPDEAV